MRHRAIQPILPQAGSGRPGRTRHPTLSVPGSHDIHAVVEGGAARQGNRLGHLGHGDGRRGRDRRCDRVGERGVEGQRRRSHIPIHPDLKAAMIALHRGCGERSRPDMPVIHSERDRGLSPGAIAVWFHRRYAGLGIVGCSSHSGRRSFVTRAARRIRARLAAAYGMSKCWLDTQASAPLPDISSMTPTLSGK